MFLSNFFIFPLDFAINFSSKHLSVKLLQIYTPPVELLNITDLYSTNETDLSIKISMISSIRSRINIIQHRACQELLGLANSNPMVLWAPLDDLSIC